MPFTPPPSVATDTNYDAGSDTWSGQPTKRAPTAGQIAKGIIPGAKLTAQLFNYLMNAFGARITELQTWADGDGNTRTIEIPFEFTNTAFDGSLNTGPEWNYVGPTELRCPTDAGGGGRNSVVFLPLHTVLPDGAVITEVSIVVKPGANRTGTDRMYVALVAYGLTARSGGSQTSTTLAGPVYDSGAGAGAMQEILLSADVSGSALPYTVDYATQSRITVDVKSGNTDFADSLYSVLVTYTDPGPRSPGKVL